MASPAIEQLTATLAAQRDHLAALERSVAAATAARDAAAADVRALEYVSDLTRDETVRRQRGNQRLARACSLSSQDEPSHHSTDVQRTEASLLAKKAQLAALRLSIDELHARRARAARSRDSAKRRASGTAIAPPGARSPRASRRARLIADVDAIVAVGSTNAPARVGVAPAGALALLGYDSAEPVRHLPPGTIASQPESLTADEETVLRKLMLAAPVQSAGESDSPHMYASVVGIREALLATAGLINSASAATRVVDDPLPPPSPRSPRRNLRA